MVDSPPGMEITEENKFKGSLFISAYAEMNQIVDKDALGQDWTRWLARSR
jgi:hypothetical protein